MCVRRVGEANSFRSSTKQRIKQTLAVYVLEREEKNKTTEDRTF